MTLDFLRQLLPKVLTPFGQNAPSMSLDLLQGGTNLGRDVASQLLSQLLRHSLGALFNLGRNPSGKRAHQRLDGLPCLAGTVRLLANGLLRRCLFSLILAQQSLQRCPGLQNVLRLRTERLTGSLVLVNLALNLRHDAKAV